MPNRIIREGIIESLDVNKLSWAAEVFYRRLLNRVDDFGRFDAMPRLLRAALYPLQLDRVSDRDTQDWLQQVEQVGLVKVYEVVGKRYLEVQKFRQQVRAKRSKYPAPPGERAAHAQHMHITCIADAQHMRTKTETESESYNKTKGSGSSTVNDDAGGGAPSPPPYEDMPERFRCWLAALCAAVPQLAAFRTLPPDVLEAARASWRCLPQAADYAPLLAAYYADRLREDRRRKEFWRPAGARFFHELADVIFRHAQRWQRETGWRPQQVANKRRKAPEMGKLAPLSPLELEERRALWESVKNDANL